jgi:hypothetical protein
VLRVSTVFKRNREKHVNSIFLEAGPLLLLFIVIALDKVLSLTNNLLYGQKKFTSKIE